VNPLLCTDVYKLGHLEQYKSGTDKVYSYLMARSAKKYPASVFFGLQYYLNKYLCHPIKKKHVKEFLKYRKMVLGSEASEWVKERLYKAADRGCFSLRIKAVPEGSKVPVRNALMTVTNTEPDAAWQVGFVESLLLKVWAPCTVATLSDKLYGMVSDFGRETCDDLSHIPFQVHDFGYRGVSSEETAAICGAAHLLKFLGTDTIPAVKFLHRHYDADETKPIGLSVPASEHSVMCSFGRENELDAFKHMLNLYPEGIVSIVSDTYDLWNVLTNFTSTLKDQILNRNGKVVFRPDSGVPELIINGNPDGTSEAEKMGVLRLLERTFGATTNQKGYRVLNSKVGCIYGDGMYYDRFVKTLGIMKENQYASSNLVVGVGGILLQQHNRDDLGFSFKATYTECNGEPQLIWKDPITDSGKKSHKGLLCTTFDGDGEWNTEDQVNWEREGQGMLKTVYEDGFMRGWRTLDEMRA